MLFRSKLPIAKPRKTLPIRQVTLLILRKQSHLVLLEKRSPMGIWASLWSLPEIPGTPAPEIIRKICKERFQFTTKQLTLGDPFRHTFSHFQLEIVPALLTVKSARSKIMEAEQQIWYDLKNSQTVGLPAPIKLLLNNLEKSL